MPTDKEIIKAVRHASDKHSSGATEMAVLRELGFPEDVRLDALLRRLHLLARTGQVRRHRLEGSRRPFFRPNEKKCPLFGRPY